MLKIEGRLHKTVARALGAEIKEDGETESKSDNFQGVLDRAKKRTNPNGTDDIVSNPIKGKGGDKFGVGHGIGYKTIGG